MEPYKTTMCMLELCNGQDISGSMRLSMDDPFLAFFGGCERDLSNFVLFFKFGAKRGKGDLRKASKTKLLEVGLELKALRSENNTWMNPEYWGVTVDSSDSDSDSDSDDEKDATPDGEQ